MNNDHDVVGQRKKILFVTMEFWPFRGGVARYYKNFCDSYGDGLTVYVVEGAPESRTQSQKVRKLESDNVGGQDSHSRPPLGEGRTEGYSAIRKKSYWKWMRPRWGKLLIDLYWYIKKHKPTVVFVGNILPIGLIMFLLQKLFGFDYVVFLHGLDIQFANRGRSYRRLMTEFILRNACSIIVNSEYTKREAVKAFGIPMQKITVLWPKAFGNHVSRIMDHVSGETPSSISPFVRGRQSGGVPIVLSAGRLVPRKGFDGVIEVAKHFVGKAKFIIFGRGPEEKNIRSSIIDNHLESTVQLITDSVSDDEMSALYDACDTFLFLPKELSGGDVEGFGQVALEAQAHGKSVIVRNSGGSGEALVDGETGFLVNDLEACCEKLELLLSDDDLRNRMGEKGRVFASSVSEGFGEQVSKLKKTLLEQTKKVSIVIPVGYDLERIISTLKSLEQQTYKNFEVIVVGDGIVIPRITNYELRITVHSISKSGAAAARNVGAKHATGEYLLFVDDDTILRDDCIEKMVRRLETRIMDHRSWIKSKVDSDIISSSKLQAPSFVYSGFKLGWKTFPAVPFNYKTAYQYPYLDITSMMRREAFPGFDESLKRLQDWDLLLTIIDQGSSGESIHEILYFKSARLFKNLLKQKGISFWFPKFVWKLPIVNRLYPHLSAVKKYQEALGIVRSKHALGRFTNPF